MPIRMVFYEMIKKIGHYLTTDIDGFLIPDVSWDKIPSHWQKLINEIILFAKNDSNTLALYVRGSVPRGLAIDGVSDLDLVFIVDAKQEALNPQIIKFKNDLLKKYPFCEGIEWLVAAIKTFDDIQTGRGLYLSKLLKTQGLHLWGSDITQDFPKVKPGIDMISHMSEFEENWSEFENDLFTASTREKRDRLSLWMGKRILRTAFEIASLDKNIFTRDLYPCYEAAAAEYPEIKLRLYKVLEIALMGAANLDIVLENFKPVAEFLIEKIKQLPVSP